MPITIAGSPKHDRGTTPADGRDQRRTDDGDDDRPDVPAGDVRADREAATFRRELLGQQAVAHGVLGRPADPRHDVRDRERREARRERLERESATEQDPADAQQVPSRHDAGQARVAQLDEAGRDGRCRRQEGDRLDAHVVVDR